MLLAGDTAKKVKLLYSTLLNAMSSWQEIPGNDNSQHVVKS